MAYRFEEFLYDPAERALFRGGREVALTPKGRDLLTLFLHNPRRLLTRREISDRLWPDVAVTDDSLRFQVAELRKALGESGERWIRTVPREGYRWETDVALERAPERGERVASASGKDVAFRLVLESREISLEQGENILGRDRDAALWIDHTSVSRHHARILLADSEATIEDLGSKNGTYVGGERISDRRVLADGDQIRIGPVSMTFQVFSRTGTTETAREE